MAEQQRSPPACLTDGLTEAGSEYLTRVGPALAELQAEARDLAGRHLAPSGPLWLTVPRGAFNGRVAPMLTAFCRIYPEIEVEVNVEGQLIDIVQHRFDAGTRYDDMLERDMVAVKLSEPSEAVLVAAPDYLARHGTSRPSWRTWSQAARWWAAPPWTGG